MPLAPKSEEDVRRAAREQLEDELANLVRPFERYDTTAPSSITGADGKVRSIWQLLQAAIAGLFDSELTTRERAALDRHRARRAEAETSARRERLLEEQNRLNNSFGFAPLNDARNRDRLAEIERELASLDGAPQP